jgi:hypothetical protein
VTDDGEGPVLPEEARERVKGFHDKPEHKFHPGPDGKDPRDERTRGDSLDDPAHNEGNDE